MKIRTAFIFDGDQQETQDEVEIAIYELEEIAPNYEFTKIVHGNSIDDIKGQRFDLIILDYGGISIGAFDIAEFHIKEICKYAENHPSCLLVIWTQFYEYELKNTFGHLNNITYRYNDEYSSDESEFIEKFQQWFGLKGE